MVFTILIIFFTLIGLLVLHELGHFFLAKKFGVEVEEFGVGYPPRIFGKKIGETIYSLNLLPFGAFVKIKGEEREPGVEDARSFSNKPLWQRALIIAGGVVSFWLIGFVIFSVIAGTLGLPTSIPDDYGDSPRTGTVPDAKVQIIGISSGSPAQTAGLKAGDIILKFDKVKEVQEFTQEHLGQEIVLTIKRGKDVLDVGLVPRVKTPEEEGPIGIVLARVAKLRYSWYQAPWQGLLLTGRQTAQVPIVLSKVLGKAIQGEKVKGVKMVGIIGLGDLMSQALNLGVDNFLLLVAMISVWLAFFNLLPIPALDGGKLLFLVIEGVRKKPVSQLVEQKITAIFFFLLIALMIFVTLGDIMRLV